MRQTHHSTTPRRSSTQVASSVESPTLYGQGRRWIWGPRTPVPAARWRWFVSPSALLDGARAGLPGRQDVGGSRRRGGVHVVRVTQRMSDASAYNGHTQPFGVIPAVPSPGIAD
jgi:hypothetical protein